MLVPCSKQVFRNICTYAWLFWLQSFPQDLLLLNESPWIPTLRTPPPTRGDACTPMQNCFCPACAVLQIVPLSTYLDWESICPESISDAQSFIRWVGSYTQFVTAEPHFSVHQYMRCWKVGNIFSESCSYMANRSDAPKIQVSFHLLMFAHLGGCLWYEGEGLSHCAGCNSYFLHIHISHSIPKEVS